MGEQGKDVNGKIHMGNLIQAEMDRQGRRAEWLAGKLYCDRTNVYKLYKRSHLDTDLLLRISQILHYDFFSAYSKTLVWNDQPQSVE